MKTTRTLAIAVGILFLSLGAILAPCAEEPEKGTPEARANAKAVAGNYYRGDGTGYNIYLTLKEKGKYMAEWHGCLGKYGEAAGQWTLADKRITLKPTKEKDMMEGHLKSLDVLKFKREWTFFSSDDT